MQLQSDYVILNALRKAFNDNGDLEDNNISFFCPNHSHHKRKLNVCLDDLMFHCWVCDVGGIGLRQIIKKFNLDKSIFRNVLFFPKNENIQDGKTVQVKVILPNEYTYLYSCNSKLAKIAQDFFETRGFCEQDALRYKIGFCYSGKYYGYLIVPSFDKNGNLNYFIGRNFVDELRLKYNNCSRKKTEIIFNEIFLDNCDEINLCEGVFDAMTCGKNSIALLGNSVNKIISYILENEKINLIFDKDVIESKKFFYICQKLLSYGLNCYFVDVNPYKDANLAGKEKMRQKIEQAKKIDQDFILKFRMELL